MNPQTWRTARAVLARPRLWRTAMRQARRLSPAGWWRRPPFVPRPDPDYLGFRLETQYGAPDAVATADDLVAYLEWCRAGDREVRREERAARR